MHQGNTSAHVRLAGRSAVLAAILWAAACGGAGEPGAEAADSSGGTRSQSIPSSMLATGGTSALPPAQEFQLDEIGFDFGSDDAPIKVVEFSDYGCGFCQRFHTGIFPDLKRDFVDTGRVQWKYVTYASGQFANGLIAAMAAECAGEQGLFAPMHLAVFERQADWKNLSQPYPVLEEIAVDAGLDAGQFAECIQEQRPRPRVRSGILSGARLGVRGTPSFMVNGIPVMGAQPYPYWEGLFSAIEADDPAISSGAFPGVSPSGPAAGPE